MYQCALGLTAEMHLFGGIRLETVNSKEHQQYATQYLKGKKCARGSDEVHNETHAITRN